MADHPSPGIDAALQSGDTLCKIIEPPCSLQVIVRIFPDQATASILHWQQMQQPCTVNSACSTPIDHDTAHKIHYKPRQPADDARS